MATLSKRSIENLIGVHPSLALLINEGIKDTPVDFTVVEGVRTTKEQSDLFAIGRTKKGRIVTYKDGIKNKSNHQVKADGFGHAVDIFPFVDGSVRVNEKYVIPKLIEITNHLKQVAKKLNINVNFGIDWKKPYDPPHIELV